MRARIIWLLSVALLALCGGAAAELNDIGVLDGGWYLIAGEYNGGLYGYIWDGTTWQSCNDITTGIAGGSGPWTSSPDVLEIGGELYIVYARTPNSVSSYKYGFRWNGTTWVSNSTIINGLATPGASSAPTFFNKSGQWHSLIGDVGGSTSGYSWTGSGWNQNNDIRHGLVTSSYSAPTVFLIDGVWYAVLGNADGKFYGYNWTSNEYGPLWQSDSAIVDGTMDVGSYSKPNIFNKYGTWHLIAGEYDGTFTGFSWTGSSWIEDAAIASGLGDIGKWSAPTIFFIEPPTLYVNETGWWNKTNVYHASATPIQSAVSNTTSGGTVYLWNGSYSENVDISTAHIIIEGEGADVVTITASSGSDHVFDASADGITITGINITGATDPGTAGIYLNGSDSVSISDCVISGNNYGVFFNGSSNNVLTNVNVTDNTVADYYLANGSVNNVVQDNDFDDTTIAFSDVSSSMMIIMAGNNLLITDRDLPITCGDSTTLNLIPTEVGYTLNITSLDVTVSTSTGSVTVSANSTLINIDYVNSTINDLNITALDRQLILESAGVQTMVFDPTNVFNLWNFEYYVNATANRKAVSFDTYTTNATNLIDFAFNNLYPSSNFDCRYDSVSFTTNTSGTTGTLEFNKSSWTENVARTVEIYMTTTPYRCDGVCRVTEGSPMVLYLDLNDTAITHVCAEITKPNGERANHSMADFIDGGATSWYIGYADTGIAGTYSVDNFYSSKDGVTWKQLDSFLNFESVVASGGGSPASPADEEEEEDEVPDGAGGGGGGAQPAPTPDEHGIKPDKRFASELTGGRATFTGSIISHVVTEQSGTVQIDEFKINPTSTSLIGGARYGYVDIIVPNRNIGGTVTFRIPDGAEDVALYQLEDNMWIELSSTRVGDKISAAVGHFSYFAVAEAGMESVIESMTQLSLTPPKVSGILVWKWLKDDYTSIHISNRQLMNVSASEGIICRIITTGDYHNRTLRCTYTPPEDEEWSSLKYTGEIIAIDTDGYTRRIPVGVNVYDMDKLGFPVFAVIILLGGIVLYRRYD